MSYYVYILANKASTVLYTGVTSDLIRRVWEHKGHFVESFTKRYNVDRLVYYEVSGDIHSAITREKQLKVGSRRKKMELIDSFNPTWRDLYDEIAQGGS
jgi:putative endonuclease